MLNDNIAGILSRTALGNAVVATGSFTPTVTAYDAGDVIAAAAEFGFTYTDGSSVPAGALIRILTTVLKIDATAVISGETSYTLQCYSVTPPSAQADAAAWTLASADLPSYLGSLTLGTPLDLGAALYVKTPNIDVDMRLTGDSLFGRLVTVGAFTGAAVARQVTLLGTIV